MFDWLRKKTPPETDIVFFNTATRAREQFQPLQKRTVRIYACGPTVYDHIHIGNLRAYLLPDLVHRLFLHHGYRVTLTINVTDFGHLTDDADAGEDKIVNGMKRQGLAINLENMRTFAEPYIASFVADLRAFGNLEPTNLTRASDYVREQIALIETLMEKGYAYETSDGVYFDISRFPTYGVLGNLDLSAMRAGARVEENVEKRHPADFALWKKSKLGWDSQWGVGFPGWHIECTAMAFATLGKQLDIHTGGEDLMYTHHNGEIAQAESITGKQYVRYWLHNAFVTVENNKMAKSKGTGMRLVELSERGFAPTDYRYWLLQSHYRTPANFTDEGLEGAQQAMLRLKRFVYEELGSVRSGTVHEKYHERFLAAFHNDLDTPQALAVLWELVKDGSVTKEDKLATIHLFDSLLSLGLSEIPEKGREELGYVEMNTLPAPIQTLILERENARQKKDWTAADHLREQLAKDGYSIEDAPEGPRISRM